VSIDSEEVQVGIPIAVVKVSIKTRARTGAHRRPVMEGLYLGIAVMSTYTLITMALILAFME
jgi:hypothetical protein